MKKEYEELLLRDLSARLPYGVVLKVDYIINNETTYGEDVPATCDDKLLRINLDEFSVYTECLMEYSGIGYIKPYLRPMSSMTEEEKRELARITNSLIAYDEDWETLESIDFYGDARLDVGMEIWLKAFDWLNKKMFAYRTYNDKNMFELGIAIPAPEGMYK